MPVLYKADGSIEIQTLTKYEAEKGELLALGYVPDSPDSQGDIADAEAVKSMAYSHMKNGAGLDIQHDGKVLTKAQAYVAESFIVQKGDPRFTDWPGVDATGAWGVLVKIEDPAIREAYKAKTLDGVSLFGRAEVEAIVKSDDAVHRIVEATIKALQGSKETDVDIKELTTALAANNTALVEALTKALKPEAPKIEEPKKDEPKAEDAAPVLKAEDRANPKKVREYLEAKKAYDLQKSVNWDDPKEVENFLTGTLEKATEESEETKTLRAEIASLEGRIASIKKASSQPTTEVTRPTQQADIIKSAANVADWANKNRGFATK